MFKHIYSSTYLQIYISLLEMNDLLIYSSVGSEIDKPKMLQKNQSNGYSNDKNKWIITSTFKTQTPFYKRLLTNHEMQHPTHAYVSHCYYNGLDTCLEGIEKTNPDSYIVCIGYKDGDYQLGLTGSCKKAEYPETAVARETLEEVDIESKSFEFVTTQMFYSSKKPYVRNSHVFKVNASTCKQSSSQRNDSYKIGQDNRKEKITCVVYGTKEEIKTIILNSRLANKNVEKIGYYVALHIKDAVNLCKRIAASTISPFEWKVEHFVIDC